MNQATGFGRVFVKWCLIGLAASGALAALMWVMARYGGLGEVRYPWLVGAILLGGTIWFAARKAVLATSPRQTPPPVEVATVSTPVARQRKGR